MALKKGARFQKCLWIRERENSRLTSFRLEVCRSISLRLNTVALEHLSYRVASENVYIKGPLAPTGSVPCASRLRCRLAQRRPASGKDREIESAFRRCSAPQTLSDARGMHISHGEYMELGALTILRARVFPAPRL